MTQTQAPTETAHTPGHMPPTCGCSIKGPVAVGALLVEDVVYLMIGGAPYVVRYCPMHAAAPEMLQFIADVGRWLGEVSGPDAISPGNLADVRRALLARMIQA